MLAGRIAYDFCLWIRCRYTFRLMPLVDNELLYRPYTLGELYDVSTVLRLLHPPPASTGSDRWCCTSNVATQQSRLLHPPCLQMWMHSVGRQLCCQMSMVFNPASERGCLLSSTGHAGVPAE